MGIAPGNAETPDVVMYIAVGDTVNLTCSLPEGDEGVPTAVFRWETTAAGVNLEGLGTDGLLEMEFGTTDMSGKYTCTPYNVVGEGGSADILVSVLGNKHNNYIQSSLYSNSR